MDLAQRVADQLGAIDGVVAVVLGGSRARGEGRPDSDLDLGIYYDPAKPPPVDALRALALQLNGRDSGQVVTELGEWGPWINGGAWLQIEGQKVDWLYRDLRRVEESTAESREGRIAVHYQPGHPFGFPSYISMGEIDYCVPLFDPQGEIARLKALTRPYPAALKRAIVDRFLWEAGFALETARSSAVRGDVSYVVGSLFRAVSCLVQVLFTVNERYLINEKGAVLAANRLPRRLPGFSDAVQEILAAPGAQPEELQVSLVRMEGVVEMVRGLVTKVGGPQGTEP